MLKIYFSLHLSEQMGNLYPIKCQFTDFCGHLWPVTWRGEEKNIYIVCLNSFIIKLILILKDFELSFTFGQII